MEIKVKAKYTATTDKKSSIQVDSPELQIELHKMIVWMMHHQSDAMSLIPDYLLIRDKCDKRDERQKTYGGQDI